MTPRRPHKLPTAPRRARCRDEASWGAWGSARPPRRSPGRPNSRSSRRPRSSFGPAPGRPTSRRSAAARSTATSACRGRWRTWPRRCMPVRSSSRRAGGSFASCRSTSSRRPMTRRTEFAGRWPRSSASTATPWRCIPRETTPPRRSGSSCFPTACRRPGSIRGSVGRTPTTRRSRSKRSRRPWPRRSRGSSRSMSPGRPRSTVVSPSTAAPS